MGYFASCFGQKHVSSINYGEITDGTNTVRETVKRSKLQFLLGISLWYLDNFLRDLQCGKSKGVSNIYDYLFYESSGSPIIPRLKLN